MKKLLTCLVAVLITTPVLAEHHSSTETEVHAAVESFNTAYASNDVEAYFNHYADGVMLYFYGARQDITAYHEEWSSMVKAGGAVEKNELSDVKVQVLQDDVAVSSYFVENTTRTPEGETATVNAFEMDVWQKTDGEWKIVSLHYSEIPAE